MVELSTIDLRTDGNSGVSFKEGLTLSFIFFGRHRPSFVPSSSVRPFVSVSVHWMKG